MISFVVPAYDEEALLGRTLRSIHAAAREVGLDYEIVVSDDASTDRTTEVAEENGARVVRGSYRQIAATRNAGARASAGERLVFVDADTEVTAAVVRGAVEALDGGAAGGGCCVRFDGRVPWHARAFLRVLMRLYRLVGLASGSFLFCTRGAFEAVGGFDESLYASEELWLSLALRRRGRFVVLREPVVTSGRKLRAYSGREVYGLLLRLTVSGMRGVRKREGLDFWYGERRPDPDR